MGNNYLKVPQGEFKLERLPKRSRELLQAWDSADEYLLGALAESLSNDLLRNPRLLIINDSFGALAVALHADKPEVKSDSYLSQQATRANLAENGLSENQIILSNSLEPLSGIFDQVLIKVPKTLALFEYQLMQLAGHLTGNTHVMVAGMVKHFPSSVWKLLESLIGPTTTTLARKKARLIHVQPDLSLKVPVCPYPSNYRLDNSNYWISNHANVFSREGLDIGTRFFLQHLPALPNISHIIDLGCGNGLLGLVAAERYPHAVVRFIDESYMAVASAKENFQRVFPERFAEFLVGDGLIAIDAASADLILCNPPFHQQHTIGDHIAGSFFSHARRVLRRQGELWVIGNRHLGYHQLLARFFTQVSIVAANAKFVIFRAVVP